MGSQNKRKIKVGMVHHNFFKDLKDSDPELLTGKRERCIEGPVSS